MNIGIILAGGIGSRFGSSIPKQYQLLLGKEVISYSIYALKKCNLIDKIIVIASSEQPSRLREDYCVEVVEGGETRNRSLYNGLVYINKNYDCDKVIVLEAARPMVTSDIVTAYLNKLDSYDAVITGKKITDSLGCFKAHYVNRDDYYLIQAPEAFRFKLLFDNFDQNSEITATNQQLPNSAGLYINFDFEDNYKITYHSDLRFCEDILKRRNNGGL